MSTSLARSFGGFAEDVKTSADMRRALRNMAGRDPQEWMALLDSPNLKGEGRKIALEELTKLTSR